MASHPSLTEEPSSFSPHARSRHVKFAGGGEFFAETRREVESYWSSGEIRARALRSLYIKTALGFAGLVGAWSWLIFGRPTLLQAAVGLLLLLLSSVVVSVCVLHDANHGAFFRSRKANHLLGWTVDVFLGFGSYAWRFKHNVSHHSYPNVDGYDDDISHAPLARMAPSQEAHWWYRWQHRYIWALYALALARWHFTDIASVTGRRVGPRKLPPARGWNLVGFFIGKTFFVMWAFVIPMLFHRWWVVVCIYALVTVGGSFVMANVFQLAHCVEEATFISAEELVVAPRIWAIHEMESTVDFCQNNRILTWFIGGLNYQIEHHLFPGLPHTVYPNIAPIIRKHAMRHGVRYVAQPSLRAAFRSHYRHIRAMARLGAPVEIEMG
jgi:linoleoyl-CoA desaturase